MFSSDLTKNYPQATNFLILSINKNKLANSYVFISKSPEDILLIVKNLSKILNCENNKRHYSTPCNSCIACKWIENNQHPHALKIVTVDKESKKEQIKIDSIRELLESLKRTSDFFRVVYFEKSNLNVLPAECCNLLLKTVEETPKRTIFIFANPTRDNILPTILSRSQIIYLTKKVNTIYKLADRNTLNITDENIFNCFSPNLKTALEKSSSVYRHLIREEINLKDYLSELANHHYEKYKYDNSRLYCNLFKKITSCFQRSNSFMQPNIILQDLFIQCTSSGLEYS